MLETELDYLYRKLRLIHYKHLFGNIREREGSLSATEAFACDVVYLLGSPTIKQLAATLGVSQSNASYKVANLEAKGYVTRLEPQDDRRECRICVADKFYSYYDTSGSFIRSAAETLRGSFTPEEQQLFEKMLRTLSHTDD